MSNKIPDAWDDDWENLADKPAAGQTTIDPTPAPPPKLTKQQRRALHAEQQKQLWGSAENPDRFHWLETQGVAVPLKQEFKPQVKLLSRKPAVPVVAKKDAGSDGLAKLNIDDGEDSEEEDRKRREVEMEERQRRAKVLREEKQRKYAEARERIMGSPNPAQSAPVAAGSREGSHARNGREARARVNGRAAGAGGGGSQPTSSADQSPARPASAAATVGGKELLFDPDDMGRRLPRREINATPKEDGPSRQPRGPESSGRGGFGFAGRGGGVVS